MERDGCKDSTSTSHPPVERLFLFQDDRRCLTLSMSGKKSFLASLLASKMIGCFLTTSLHISGKKKGHVTESDVFFPANGSFKLVAVSVFR